MTPYDEGWKDCFEFLFSCRKHSLTGARCGHNSFYKNSLEYMRGWDECHKYIFSY